MNTEIQTMQVCYSDRDFDGLCSALRIIIIKNIDRYGVKNSELDIYAYYLPTLAVYSLFDDGTYLKTLEW